jgi:hypothetical protein
MAVKKKAVDPICHILWGIEAWFTSRMNLTRRIPITNNKKNAVEDDCPRTPVVLTRRNQYQISG